MKAIAIPLFCLTLLAGCTPHHTGATHFFMPVVNDWKTYDISVRNLVMNAEEDTGDRHGKDDLRFKTKDGNDIETDVTVRWRVDPKRVIYLWQHAGPDSITLEERLVRPLARTYIRDELNKLNSEDFYNPTKRFEAARVATTLLADHLRPFGISVEQVLLGDFSFKPEYQRLINARKEAEKTAEKLEAEIHATEEANQANLQSKVAELTEQLTRTQGNFEQAKRAADAYVVKRQQEAQAILAEKTAQAEGIRKERAALNSSAGDAYVNLQLIEALQKKEIRHG